MLRFSGSINKNHYRARKQDGWGVVKGLMVISQRKDLTVPNLGSLVGQMVKNLPAMQETWVRSLGWEDSPGGGHGNLLQYSCLENPRGQRSLAGYSPQGRKEGT